MQLPKTMRASVYEDYGSPDALKIQTVSVPHCGNNEVLVRVHCSTVNRTDCGFLRGKPHIVRLFSGLLKPKSKILGCEFAGEVVQKGKQATGYEIGDRVFGFKDDDFGFGGHAEYTTMPVGGMLMKIPDSLSYQEVAPALEGAHYALFGIRATGVGKAQKVLVNGGTGAIGSATVQICASMDADVTAVCGTEHVDTMRSLGARQVVDYQRDDFTKLDEQFDVVMDSVGKSTFGQCKPIIKDNGSYISSELGPYCQNPFLALFTPLFGKKQVHFPIPTNQKTDAEYICALMERKQFTPLIDRVYDFEDIASAFHYAESGQKIGNLVINIVDR